MTNHDYISIFKGPKGYINKIVYNFICANADKGLTFQEIALAIPHLPYCSHVTAPTAFQAALAIRALRRAGMVA